jgi:hypothetical protein
MSDPFDPLDPLDPTDALDEEDLLEEQISDMDGTSLDEDRMTAAELRESRSIDDALRREVPDVLPRQPRVEPLLIDRDAPDVEGQLLADDARSAGAALSAEEDAMREVVEAPGANDDEDDGYGDDED